MLYKIPFLFVIISIISSIYGEPKLPDAKSRCPTCVKYTGSIKLMDLDGSWNYVMTIDGVYPNEMKIQYRDVKTNKKIRAFYYITDPMKMVPEPLTDLNLSTMRDLSKGIAPMYDLTTILASFLFPVGLPYNQTVGSRPIPLGLRSTYYMLREPTPCNYFNITVEIATLESKLDPYVRMPFMVTKPGKSCKTPPKPTTPKPTEPATPKSTTPKATQPPTSATTKAAPSGR